jgi:hypothetical protein
MKSRSRAAEKKVALLFYLFFNLDFKIRSRYEYFGMWNTDPVFWRIARVSLWKKANNWLTSVPTVVLLNSIVTCWPGNRGSGMVIDRVLASVERI